MIWLPGSLARREPATFRTARSSRNTPPTTEIAGTTVGGSSLNTITAISTMGPSASSGPARAPGCSHCCDGWRGQRRPDCLQKWLLPLLRLSFHVSYCSVEFLAPHVMVVIAARSGGARSCHTLDRPGSFLDLLVIESAQRQLRRVERDSISAMDC